MKRHPQRSTRTDTLFPYTTLFRSVALMLVAQIGQALGGDWSRVERVVKLGVFVNSTPGFTDQAKVANGASELFETLFGEAGRHARAAVGVAEIGRAHV